MQIDCVGGELVGILLHNRVLRHYENTNDFLQREGLGGEDLGEAAYKLLGSNIT
jgi:hypothetical protein